MAPLFRKINNSYISTIIYIILGVEVIEPIMGVVIGSHHELWLIISELRDKMAE